MTPTCGRAAVLTRQGMEGRASVGGDGRRDVAIPRHHVPYARSSPCVEDRRSREPLLPPVRRCSSYAAVDDGPPRRRREGDPASSPTLLSLSSLADTPAGACVTAGPRTTGPGAVDAPRLPHPSSAPQGRSVRFVTCPAPGTSRTGSDSHSSARAFSRDGAASAPDTRPTKRRTERASPWTSTRSELPVRVAYPATPHRRAARSTNGRSESVSRTP